ncbi:MAG TPA: type II toxin-antitoxin system RelB/DinJ family antitoxin [Candidatus Kapabacteria bacterium]|nr:type II toxin-antitoxin system RelB/DinJ family antitoxin [Candidatus Kapabacteria bacterium]
MAKTAMIRARIEPELKEEVERVLEKLGMSVSEAISLFFKQVKYQRGMPFDVRIPNRATLRTIKKTDAGKKLTQHESLRDLRKHLGFE